MNPRLLICLALLCFSTLDFAAMTPKAMAYDGYGLFAGASNRRAERQERRQDRQQARHEAQSIRQSHRQGRVETFHMNRSATVRESSGDCPNCAKGTRVEQDKPTTNQAGLDPDEGEAATNAIDKGPRLEQDNTA